MLEEKKDKVKVVFIHGRPSGHPIHMEYAKLLNSDFHFEDYYLPWLDNEKAGKLRRYISWVINAFFFPNKKKYDVFFCECLRVPPFIMKKIGLMKSHQKLVALMADESLYFLDQGKYSWLTRVLIKSFLNTSDAIFCIGDLQYDLAIKYTKPKNHNNIVKIDNGISPALQKKLNAINRINNNKIKLFIIANLGASWRAWYKGVDIAIAAFLKISKIDENTELSIIGDVNDDVRKELMKKVPQQLFSKIHFLGSINNLESILDEFDLCLHVSRGDAFPTSTLEVMSAGIPVILSKDTGTKSIVELIDMKLVVDIDVEQTYNAIRYYINLSDSDKFILKDKIKFTLKEYNSDMTNSRFKQLFYSKVKELIN